ncbi:MAG TPA: hypothetical protein VMU95_01610 [Trebonia sp.]|nr:hypothetical protein [Trebonia sp.]
MEQAVLADVLPDDAAFALCERLFRGCPMAVRRHYAEFRYGSMVLVSRATGAGQFSVLIMERDDLFVLRPWDRREWPRVEIRPDEPVSDHALRLIRASVPVPRDGVLLGWVSGGQVRAVLLAHGRLAEPWEDSSELPGITTLPLAGSDPACWPPVLPGLEVASSLDETWLWEQSDHGQVADLARLVSRQAGCAFWVPGQPGRATGYVVVTERLGTAQCWLPAGVYASYAELAQGIPLPPARQLLAQPGLIDLGLGTRAIIGS